MLTRKRSADRSGSGSPPPLVSSPEMNSESSAATTVTQQPEGLLTSGGWELVPPSDGEEPFGLWVEFPGGPGEGGFGSMPWAGWWFPGPGRTGRVSLPRPPSRSGSLPFREGRGDGPSPPAGRGGSLVVSRPRYHFPPLPGAGGGDRPQLRVLVSCTTPAPARLLWFGRGWGSGSSWFLPDRRRESRRSGVGQLPSPSPALGGAGEGGGGTPTVHPLLSRPRRGGAGRGEGYWLGSCPSSPGPLTRGPGEREWGG